MPGLASSLFLCCLCLAPSAGTFAASGMGRSDVLIDAHGYNAAGAVVVPIRPIAEWLGATVEARGKAIRITRDTLSVGLTMGGTQASVNGRAVTLSTPARVYGGVTCVPVRFVAEAFGCEVSYVAEGSVQWDKTGYIPHVLIAFAGETARVLVHAAPPDVVASILAAVDREEPGRGTEYLLGVTAFKGNWAKAHHPNWDEAYGFGQRWGTLVLQRAKAGWRQVYTTTRVSHDPADLRQAGVPIEVAKALGMEVE